MSGGKTRGWNCRNSAHGQLPLVVHLDPPEQHCAQGSGGFPLFGLGFDRLWAADSSVCPSSDGGQVWAMARGKIPLARQVTLRPVSGPSSNPQSGRGLGQLPTSTVPQGSAGFPAGACAHSRPARQARRPPRQWAGRSQPARAARPGLAADPWPPLRWLSHGRRGPQAKVRAGSPWPATSVDRPVHHSGNRAGFSRPVVSFRMVSGGSRMEEMLQQPLHPPARGKCPSSSSELDGPQTTGVTAPFPSAGRTSRPQA